MNKLKQKSLLIKNGRVVNPATHTDEVCDLLILDGKIEKIGKNLKVEKVPVFDATGKVVAPGFIDMHVHLREPGFEYKENIESGSRAAIKGGFTSVCCMPNTQPAMDNAMVVKYVQSIASEVASARIFPIGAITLAQKGEHLSEIGSLHKAGVVAISDDGYPVKNSELMRRAMEYAKMFDLLVIDHCEDPDLAHHGHGVMNEGKTSTILGLKGIPKEAETIMIARDIQLARLTQARLHVAHLSTAESVALVRAAKKEGLAVSCEVAPHHFSLTDEAVVGYNANLKMNPPLREQKDIDAILAGLKDGTIDCIATDHAPHADYEKNVELDYAPFGVIGLETSVSLGLTRLVHEKVLTLAQWVDKMSTQPAKLLNLKELGSLEPGKAGDVTILDLNQAVEVSVAQMESKSKNTPFDGWKLKGAAVATIVAGNLLMENGELK